MGIDLVVDMPCQPKAFFGGGDPERGTAALVSMLKAKSRAEAVMRMGAPSVTVVVRTPQGDRQTQVTPAQLMAEAAPLDQAAGGCNGCPARTYDAPYACSRYVDYPIPAAAEGWLMQQLQPRDRLGGIVCMMAIHDFGWDGAPIRTFRENGLLASPQPVVRDLGGGAVVSSDSVLQAMFTVGPLSPMHSVILLSWFGAIEMDGRPLAGNDKSALGPLLQIPPEQRAARTRFVLAPPPADAPHFGVFLYSAYRAWLVDAALVVDA